MAVDPLGNSGAVHSPERQTGRGHWWLPGWDPTPTFGVFKHLVASGMVRYVYASGGAEEAKAGNTATAAVDQWLKDHGTVVSPSAYGAKSGVWTLYHVSRTS